MAAGSGYPVDPLIIDLAGDGIDVSSLASSHAYFDIAGTGYARNVAWASNGDGMLAVDANANGKIDDIAELFGNATQTGFAELATLDTNADNKITAADAAWNNLRVWIDGDSDGYTDAGELKTLAQLGITEFGLTTTAANTNINGNTLVETATAVVNGQTRTVGEVLLDTDPSNTVYDGDLDALKWEAMTLPALRGYGTVADLTIAMSNDDNLLSMMQDLTAGAGLGMFDAFRAELRNVMFQWAGVQTVDPASRGAGTWGNAQELGFLERYTGLNFITPAGNDPLYQNEWNHVMHTFNAAELMLAARILAQTDASLQSVVRYDMATDEIGFLSVNTGDLTAHAPTDANQKALYWSVLAQAEFDKDSAAGVELHEFILGQMGATGANLTAEQMDYFNADVGTAAADPYLDGIDRFRHQILIGNDGDDAYNWANTPMAGVTYVGGNGNDTTAFTGLDDLLIGGAGNDEIWDGDGNDTIYFGLGDGDDVVMSGAFADTDSIVFGTGITATDVTYARVDRIDLLVTVGAGGDSILVKNFFSVNYTNWAFSKGIERFVFADGTVHANEYILSQVTTWSGNEFSEWFSYYYNPDSALIGSNYSETINALGGNDYVHAQDGHDTVYGGTGDDTLVGGLGNDTLYGGDGADVIQSNEGDDALYGEAGDDTLQGIEGDDILVGGAGADSLQGGDQNDLYKFSGGDGADTLVETSGADRILFGAGVLAANVVYSKNFSNLVITYGAGDTITVSGFFHGSMDPAPFQVEAVEYADGMIHTVDYIAAKALVQYGTAVNEALYGYAYADYTDTIWAGGGYDSIYGYGGSDVYGFNAGDGEDVISDYSGALDQILFGASVTTGMVSYLRSGDNLIVKYGATDQVTVGGFFYAAGPNPYKVEQVKFNSGAIHDVNYMIAQASIQTGTNADELLSGFDDMNDTLNGLGGNDWLYGYNGNDTLDGGLGGDTMYGGLGDDTYIVDNVSDVTYEGAGAGADTVRSSITLNMLSTEIENLILTGASVIHGTGNTLANTLDGAQNAAANTLTGLAGDDVYIIGAGDTVVEAASAGTDTVRSGVTHTLAANIENLTLIGATAINGTGNTLANILRGNAAANVLTGGTGNDYYYVSTGDTVTEAASAGTDTVEADVNWTLGLNTEYLVLAGSGNINGTGNTLANQLTGNGGNNLLNGMTGGDTMTGLGGNDTYTVDNAGDVVVEASGGGTDLVNAAVTHTLAVNVENLTLTAATNINGTGNVLDNVITGAGGVNILTGNDGNDTLYGMGGNDNLSGGNGNDILDGGIGNDAMNGGAGDDIFYVDSATDTVTEALNGGTDTVRSTITHTAAANVENVELQGTAALNATGNTLANSLTGNSGVNTLTGAAGSDVLNGKGGADILWGGTEQDTFRFDLSAIGSIDTVKDFSNAQLDKLDVRDLLTGYDPLTSAVTDFVQIADAGANSTLSVDRDGAGTTYGWTQIATLENVTGLTDEALLASSGRLILA